MLADHIETLHPDPSLPPGTEKTLRAVLWRYMAERLAGRGPTPYRGDASGGSRTDLVLFLAYRDDDDREAMDALFDRHAGKLLGVASRYVGADRASDMVQEAFLVVIDDPERVEKPDSIRAFLFSAVRLRCLRLLREDGRFGELNAEATSGRDEAVEDDHIEALDLRDRYAAAAQYLFDHEDLLTQQMVSMKYDEGLDAKAIADALEVSHAMVRKRLSRALRRLRAHLEGGADTASSG